MTYRIGGKYLQISVSGIYKGLLQLNNNNNKTTTTNNIQKQAKDKSGENQLEVSGVP